MNIKCPAPEELMMVSLTANAVMTNEQAELFIKEFGNLIHDKSVIPYSERFSGDIQQLKKESKCGKYKTGMIYKDKYGKYFLIYTIIDDNMVCIRLSQEKYELIHQECSNYKNWNNSIPLDLLSYTGIYNDKGIFKLDSTGIINSFSKENVDDQYEFIEKLNDELLCYIFPEIMGR